MRPHLQRVVTWATAGLERAAAARVRAAITRSPVWAACYAYALGYHDGGEDARQLVEEADDEAFFERNTPTR